MITIEHLHVSSLRSRLRLNAIHAIHLHTASERSALRAIIGLFTKGEMTDDCITVTVTVSYLQLK